MIKSFVRNLLPVLAIYAVAIQASAEPVDSQAILESLDIESGDIKKLEDGEVVTWSGEPYEQSKRELASDATVIIHKDLDTVLAEINEQASLIPQSVTEGYQDIVREADFDGISFKATSEREFKEVELLHNLKKGEDYNLTPQEFATLTASLKATQNASREEKTEAASKAIRELLLGRYRGLY